jgi:hypothetical protein
MERPFVAASTSHWSLGAPIRGGGSAFHYMGQAPEKCVSMLMARKKSGALVAALCFDLVLQILYVFIFRLALAEQGVRNFFWQIYDIVDLNDGFRRHPTSRPG